MTKGDFDYDDEHDDEHEHASTTDSAGMAEPDEFSPAERVACE